MRFWVFFSVFATALVLGLLGLEGSANRIDRAGEESLVLGTWRQYCPQLLVQRGSRPFDAVIGCRNTPPTLENMRGLLYGGY